MIQNSLAKQFFNVRSYIAPSRIFEICDLKMLLIFWPLSFWLLFHIYKQLSLPGEDPNYRSCWIIAIFDDNFASTIFAARDISIKDNHKILLLSNIVIKCSIVYCTYRNNYETITLEMHYQILEVVFFLRRQKFYHPILSGGWLRWSCRRR